VEEEVLLVAVVILLVEVLSAECRFRWLRCSVVCSADSFLEVLEGVPIDERGERLPVKLKIFRSVFQTTTVVAISVLNSAAMSSVPAVRGLGHHPWRLARNAKARDRSVNSYKWVPYK
jgi:hypothetical protein